MTQDQAQVATQTGVGGDTGAATTQPQLSITDLQNLRTILDVAVRRGAFGAAELSSVGATFDRLSAFLNAVAPAQTETTSDSQTAAQ